jgi:hypothetical protein
VGGEFEVLLVVHLRIGCILSYGGRPFVLAVLSGSEVIVSYCTLAEFLIHYTTTRTSCPINFHIFSAKHEQETEIFWWQ